MSLFAKILMRIARILHWGATEAARVHFFSKKSWLPFFSCHPQKLTSPSLVHIFGINQAHRTLLVDRTVLLYWIKQALRPNKASLFPLKKSPWPLAMPMRMPYHIKTILLIGLTITIQMLSTEKGGGNVFNTTSNLTIKVHSHCRAILNESTCISEKYRRCNRNCQ